MIERYTRPEIGAVWTDQARMDAWLQVEIAAVEALAEQGVVPADDARAVRELATFTVDAVKERERVTDHDVAAFVDVVAQSVGEPGRWVHYGLTSSDVLDTALALQIRKAGEIIVAGARAFRVVLNSGVPLVIAHASKDTGIGFDARELADTGVERVGVPANEIAGDHGELRPQFERRIDHAGKFAFTEKSAQMDVTQLQDAQSLEVARKIVHGDLDFPHTEIRALHERAVAHGNEGRRQHREALPHGG